MAEDGSPRTTGAPGDDTRIADYAEPYLKLRRRLSASVRRICPPWLSSQSEDIVQAALLRLHQIAERAEGKAELPASYLWKVAYSATIDEIRRLRRRAEVPLEVAGEASLAQGGPDPEAERAAQEVGEGLLDCVGRLAEGRRLAVTLHLQGHSVPEIGRSLEWGTKRAENLVYRGLVDLRRCLESKGLKP